MANDSILDEDSVSECESAMKKKGPMLCSNCQSSNKANVVRSRLNYEQTRQLEAEFERNANWSPPFVTMLAERVGLKRSKVYKWAWDRKRRMLASAAE